MMYRVFILTLFFFYNNILLSQNEFITTWEVTNSDLNITIPTNSYNYTYNYNVDFGDGSVLNNQTGNTSHTYNNPGTYTVKVSGEFPYLNGFLLPLNGDADDLRTVEQWGNIQWESMENAFRECIFLVINATDAPNLSNVTSMSEMFFMAESVNQQIGHWDVSNITDMNSMFNGARSFDQALNNWDVSSVTDMSIMFSNADAFNQALNNWDVSNVTAMDGMFYGADAFNQPIDNWNVSNVTTMASMFSNAYAFNQSLDNWDVSNVTDMEGMFVGAAAFNQPLNKWDVSSVLTMQEMFWEATAFNQPLNNWDVSNVTDMQSMFSNAVAFNQPLNNWDVSNVTIMSAMFEATDAFNQPLNNWDVTSVRNMTSMFSNAVAFNQPLNNWDVSNVTIMRAMFEATGAFNQPLNNWNVSLVSNFDRMFYNAVFNQDLSSWNFNNYTPSFNRFIANSGIDIQNFDSLLDRFAQLNIENGSLDAEGLEFCDIFTFQYLKDILAWDFNNLNPETDLGSNCNANYIKGNIKFDGDGDGCDTEDIDLTDQIVSIDNGQETISTLSNNNGNFTFKVIQESYEVGLLIHLPYYLTVTPPRQKVTFNGTNEIQDNINFCITANQSVEDLSIKLFPNNNARPGSLSLYELVVFNKGTQPVSNVEVVVSFDETEQSFETASRTPSNTTSNSLEFLISKIPVLNSEVINFNLRNVQPPALDSGDVITLSASVSPNTNDLTPENNTAVLKQTIINSYDPNDKLVMQGDAIAIDNIDEYLDYKIRFQNVGTANAINVKVTDNISDKLDWSTFQPINASHDYRLEFANQEEINFIFDNINLPYKSVDEEGSNGHVSFKIKPKPSVQVGDVIENKANIYFDYNAPIITNTVSTTIVNNLGLNKFTKSESVKLLPNPTSHHVEIISNSDISIKSVELYSVIGKLVKSYNDTALLDVSHLNSGLYLMKIKSQNGSLIKKLIIDN